jgi:hypothetical protein
VAIIEQCDVQGEQRRRCGIGNGGDEWRHGHCDVGRDAGREPRRSEQCGEGEWTDDGIDDDDGGWEDDWECGIISGMSGGRIDGPGERVDIMDGCGVSARMGRRITGRGRVDGGNGPDIGWGREHEHVGELRWCAGEQRCSHERSNDGRRKRDCGRTGWRREQVEWIVWVQDWRHTHRGNRMDVVEQRAVSVCRIAIRIGRRIGDGIGGGRLGSNDIADGIVRWRERERIWGRWRSEQQHVAAEHTEHRRDFNDRGGM